MLKKYLFGLVFTMVSLLPLGAQQFGNTGRTEDAVLVAYPTMARDVIYIKTKNTLRIKAISFYSILGMQVQEVFVPNLQAAQIELDRLKSGKYLMRCLLSDGSQKVISIVKL